MSCLSSPAHIARLAVFALVGALLASCAVPGGPQGGGTRVERVSRTPVPPAEPKYSLVVTELRGRAWVQRDGRPSGLKDGSTVGENQPIQVGARSILRMQLGDEALFELAPNTRLVVHQLPRDGRGDARATWLRIEQGYLRIQWNGALMDPPMQVSFGIWAARLEPGEYFFDTRGRVAAVCAASGSMRLSGVPEWTPQGSMQECLKLEANKSPLAIAMTDAQWNTVRAQRRLHPTLAKAARKQSKAAIARLEREQVRSPGPRPPAPAPAPVAKAPPVTAAAPVAAAPRTPVPSMRREPAPPVAVVRPAPPTRAEDDATRERTADELIHEAEEVRNAARSTPAPAPPPANPKMPAPAPSIAMGPSPPATPVPPLPDLTRRPVPVTPAPPPEPPPPAVAVVPPPEEPEPAYEVVEPPRTGPRSPPVIVIPAEPEPEPEATPAAPPPVAVVPPSPPPPEPAYEVVEPPQMAQRSPPVIVIPAEPEPAEPTPPPPPPAPAPPPPAVALAPPAPPPVVTPTPRSPPVITVPAEPEPEPEPQPVTPPPSAPPPSPVGLAEQAPVVIPPSTQPPASDSGPRPRGSATPPSVPLDVAMYSVAAMPDRIGASQSALIVPPTITHEPANSQWLVNIASYPTVEGAKNHARMLVKQKLRAGVREQALPDRMSYLVVIEGYPTEEAAEAAAIDLETHFDLDPY